MSLNPLFSLPADQRAQIESELHPGETITWSAQPTPRALTLQTIPVILFGLPWTAFAIFWTVSAANLSGRTTGRHGPGIFGALFGVPFILIGLGLLSSPFWVKRVARRTYYLITNRRALIVQLGRSKTTRSFAFDQIQSLTKRERRDGSGDLLFGSIAIPYNAGRQRLIDNGFYSVPNVKEVETLLMNLTGHSSVKL